MLRSYWRKRIPLEMLMISGKSLRLRLWRILHRSGPEVSSALKNSRFDDFDAGGQSPITASLVFSIASLFGKFPVTKATYSERCTTGKFVFNPVDLEALP